MRRVAAVATAGVLLLLPTHAFGATVRASPPDDEGNDGAISVRDERRERNRLEVFGGPRRITVVERGRAPLKAGRGCRRRAARVVTCRSDQYTVYVDGGRGDDVVRCGYGGFIVDGGPGRDHLISAGCGAWLYGKQGADVLVGDRFAQRLRGGAGDDRLSGGAGDDKLWGDGWHRRQGRDVLDGGAGEDIASWDERRRGVRADLRRGIGGHRGERDRLIRIEDAGGGTGSDVLLGDGGANHLRGSEGVDLLVGRGGDDVLDGGQGSPGIYADLDDDVRDRLRCGAGRDVVRYPARTALPVGCEFMRGPGLDFTKVPARPRPAGRGRVAVPVVCFLDCTRRVVVTAGGRELGKTRLRSTEHGVNWIVVRLRGAAPRNGTVRIIVDGEDMGVEPDVLDEDESDPYRFSWRLRCRGAPPGDVCRAGG